MRMNGRRMMLYAAAGMALPGGGETVERPKTGLALLEATLAKPKVTFTADSGIADDVVTFTVNKADFFAAMTMSESGKTVGVTFALTGIIPYLNGSGAEKRASVNCAGARATVKMLND